jgi:hypothetical protein
MRAILLLATRIIASSVIGCGLTGTVHSATLKPTSLKTSSVVGDDKVWRVTDDKKDSDGDYTFELAHVKVDDCEINLTEVNVLVGFLHTHAQFWKDYKATMIPVFKNFKEVALPAAFKAPTGMSCNANEASLSGQPDSTSIVCSLGKGRFSVVYRVTVPKLSPETCIKEINTVTSTFTQK